MSATTLGLGEVAGCQGDQPHADGDVEEQAPPPGDPTGQHPAEDQADAAATSGHRAVGADGPRPGRPLPEADLEQGQRGGCGHRRPDALDGPRREEPLRRTGPVPHQGGHREQRDPRQEDPPPARGYRRPGRRGAGAPRRSGCRRSAPRTARWTRTPATGGSGQGGDDDGGIEDDHQVSGQDDGEDDGGVAEAPPFGASRPRSWARSSKVVGMTVHSVRQEVCAGRLKWRRPPQESGGALRLLYGGQPPLCKRPQGNPEDRPMPTADTLPEAVARRPKRADARRNYDKVVAAGPGRLRRGGWGGVAGGDRPAGRGRDRHVVPELPLPPRPAGGGLRGGGRGCVPVGRGAAGRRRPGMR